MDTPKDFSKENFPAFLGYVPEDGARYFYGLPIHEYPGLVKVYILAFSIEYALGFFLLFFFQICIHYGEKAHQPETGNCVKKTRKFVENYFKGVSAVPSIVEPCIYTVIILHVLPDFILKVVPSVDNSAYLRHFEWMHISLAATVTTVYAFWQAYSERRNR